MERMRPRGTSPWRTRLLAILFLARSTSSSLRSFFTFSSSRSEEHTSELQSPYDLVCRLLLEKKKNIVYKNINLDVNYKLSVLYNSFKSRKISCATINKLNDISSSK